MIKSNHLALLAQNKLKKAGICLQMDAWDEKMLEQQLPAVFVCNALLPGLDEWMLMALLAGSLQDVQLLHPYPTPAPKMLSEVCIRPRPRKLSDGIQSIGFAKKLDKTVKKGQSVVLVIDFSDNPISHLGKNMLRRNILEQLYLSGVPIVPVHFQVEKTTGGMLRKNLPVFTHGLLNNKEEIQVSARIGQALTPADRAQFTKARIWGKFVQAKIFALGSTLDVQPGLFAGKKKEGQQQPLVPAVDVQLLAADVAALSPECHVTARGPFDVYVAPAKALPNLMTEIARLRELTFRAAGEGTGKPLDMDAYDLYYLQLFVWDRESRRLVGGYRLGPGDAIFKKYGVNGFYTNSLFKIKTSFYPILEQAIELGRSYVAPDYQKHRLPLFLLWKGILHYLMANPRYRYLYGPVSISRFYSKVSKSLIVEFVKQYFYDEALAAMVRPRKPFRVRTKAVNTKLLAQNMKGEFESLESFVENIEPDHFKVPVLFRQYLKQNARFIAFNVDPLFADCLDGLMLLDIRDLPESTIEVLQQER